jgi:hypothetical protein
LIESGLLRSPVLADALASAEILAKYPVFFLYDVPAQLKTLDFLEGYDASIFVPCHAAPDADVRALVR